MRQDEARITPHGSVDAVDVACAEENAGELTTHNLSSVHPGCPNLSSITLPNHTYAAWTSSVMSTRNKSQCQASKISVSSPVMNQRQLRLWGSAFNVSNKKKHRTSYFEIAGGIRHVMLLSPYWISPCDSKLHPGLQLYFVCNTLYALTSFFEVPSFWVILVSSKRRWVSHIVNTQ